MTNEENSAEGRRTSSSSLSALLVVIPQGNLRFSHSGTDVKGRNTLIFDKQSAIIALVVLTCPVASIAQGNTPQTTASSAKDPLVTFVNNGFSLTGGLPGQKSEGFRGKLFVGDEPLAMMSGTHFATFHFDPGPIEFTAQTWMASGTLGGAHLKLNLVAEKHYFVEVRTRDSWPVTKAFGIKEVTCDEARKEHEHDKPVESKHLDNAGHATLIAETSFPACPASNVSNQQERQQEHD